VDYVAKHATRVLSESTAGKETSELFLDLVRVAEGKSSVTRSRVVKRTAWMYVIIVTLWAALCVPYIAAVVPVVERGIRYNDWVGGLVAATALFITFFWLNGVKDVVYPFAYRLTRWRRQSPPPRASKATPLVGLLYVTCNDFSADALSASIIQDYPNYEIVILDDSYKDNYRAQVDAYASEHGIPVIRRSNRQGYKAGNLNHFLRTAAGQRYDYFVIVDSDEILPRSFIDRILDYFQDPSVGIVQANHIATRNRTRFMRTFAPGVDSHFPVYQLVKAYAGFLSLLGHGAMISRQAYQAAGGFPEIVAEDIGFAIDCLRAGYRTDFAADIICEEEFPPDYAAFKKRHRKWTDGNMEFMRRYTRRILFDRAFRWYERLDIILFTYSLPLTGVFSLYVIVNAILFPLIGFRYQYPLWMLAPTVVCLFAPMINDMLTWRKAPKGRLLSYLLHSMMLFGSMFFVSLFASVRSTFKASVFNVTPKQSASTGLRFAVRRNADQLIAGAILAVIVEVASGSVLPVILLLIPVIFIIYMSVMNANDGPQDELNDAHILQEEDN